MRPQRALGLVALVFVAALGTSAPAHAWTRTVVHSARATVEIERDATLYILLRLDIEVHAGWLHELELVDLGPGIELDRYRPPYLRSEDGEIFRPEAELHEDGRIRLWFPRRDAPRRGEYKVFMRYRTEADARAVKVRGEPRARIVWSVPTWETGLHNVTVELRAPKGASVPQDMQDTPPGVSFEVMERPKRTVVRWRRIHLPRMTSWPITLDAPLGSMELPSRDPAEPVPDGFRPLPLPQPRHLAWSLFLLAGLVLWKRRTLEQAHGRDALWVRAPWPAVLASTAGLVLVAQWLAPTELAWGLPLILFALHRRSQEEGVVETKEWRPIRWNELSARARPDLVDGTSPLGAALWLACGAGLYTAGQPAGALLLLPIFLTGTRYHFPPDEVENLRALRSFASELRLGDDAPSMCFSWERAEGAKRLRVHLPADRAGLLSVAFAAVSSAWGPLRRRSVMLLVETRAQSEADDLMRRRTGSAGHLRATDGAILRLVPWNTDAVELFRVLARKAPKAEKASRGTWLLREISEPNRKAA